MMTFGCELCRGICCLNPPNVKRSEAEKAKRLGAEMVSFKRYEGYYVSIKPNGDMCPFWEDGSCSIYDERFESCRNFECKAIGEDPLRLTKLSNPFMVIDMFRNPKRTYSAKREDVFWSKEEIEKYAIPVVSEQEFIKLVLARNPLLFGRLVIESINAHLCADGCEDSR